MTIASYRLRLTRVNSAPRLKLTRVNELKIKVATHIPAQLVAGTGVAITKANGVYTFDVDTDEIEDIAEAAVAEAVAGLVGTSIQAQDSDLQALADNSTNGLWARTAAGTGAARTITGTANQITVTNGNGVSGNPTLSIPSNAALPGSPTTTTASFGDNSTKIATTAFVQANSGAMDIIHIKDYGAVGDGSTDDTAALLAWLAAINASTAYNVTAQLGSGNYPLASGTATSGLAITRSNVTIDGNGAKITVTGSSVIPYIFGCDGKTFITYKNIQFVGNSQANAFANGAAIAFTAFAANAHGLVVENCYFNNFKGDYWIYAENTTVYSLTSVTIRNNFATSASGNARGPSNVAIASSFVGVFGSADPGYLVSEVLIENNVVNADYIKSGVIVQNQVVNTTIQNNTIWNAGQQGISNDCGAYAIQIYANTPFTPGYYIRTTGNKIISPRSIGIYQANTWTGSIIANNFITGQGPDTLDTTLPKGGICINGSDNCVITGNQIYSTTKAAIWCNTSPTAHTGLVISNNQIRSCARGIVFESATYNGTNILIEGNSIRDPATNGIVCRSYTGVTTTLIGIKNNQISLASASSVGITMDSPTSTFQFFYCDLSNNTIISGGGTTSGIKFDGFTAASSIIRDNTLFGTFSATVTTAGSTGITTANNTNIA